MSSPTGFGWNKAIQKMYGPAPKEEEMENPKRTICDECKALAFEENGKVWCPNCSNRKADLLAERRAVARDAYMAALGGLMTLAAEVDCGVKGLVSDAEMAAIETVRRWDAFMAAVDAEGGE